MVFGIEDGGGERALFIFGGTLDAESGVVFFTDGFFERVGVVSTAVGSGTSAGTITWGCITGLGTALGDDSITGVSSTAVGAAVSGIGSGSG